MDRLRAGIIGIGGYGAKVLAELAASEMFKVQAIADRNRELAESAARQHQAEPYDDYRSLIVQEKLDVLFLTLPTFLCGECIQLAAKAKMHVFKEAPLARTLPEAAQWVKSMDKAQRRFHVATQKRFAPGYLQARQLAKQGRIGQVYFVRAEVFLNHRDEMEWRGDPLLAGGGVLLELGYHMIDQISWHLGPCERVYSLTADECGKRTLPPARTEDTAVLTMTFADGSMGNLLCSWMSGPAAERLTLHGTEGTIEAGVNTVRIFDQAGLLTDSETYRVDDAWLVAQQIRQLGGSLLDSEIRPINLAREHLVNVAIVEAAYLSARTHTPETLKVYGPLFDIE